MLGATRSINGTKWYDWVRLYIHSMMFPSLQIRYSRPRGHRLQTGSVLRLQEVPSAVCSRLLPWARARQQQPRRTHRLWTTPLPLHSTWHSSQHRPRTGDRLVIHIGIYTIFMIRYNIDTSFTNQYLDNIFKPSNAEATLVQNTRTQRFLKWYNTILNFFETIFFPHSILVFEIVSSTSTYPKCYSTAVYQTV